LNELEEISFMSDIAQARVEAHRDERSFWAHYSNKYNLPNFQLNQYELLPNWLNPNGNSFEINLMGRKTPEETMNAFMSSEVHKKFILNPNWKFIGTGFADENWPYYWYDTEHDDKQCLPLYYIEDRQGTSKTGSYVWTGDAYQGNFLTTYWGIWLGGYELSNLVDKNYSDYDKTYVDKN
jgi:hypothetical protein